MEDYLNFIKTQKVVKLKPDDELQDISQRKNKNTPFLLAILKTRMNPSDFTKRKDSKLFFDFHDLLQINYQKYDYEFSKGELKKSTTFRTQTSFIHPEALNFEIFAEGVTSDPDLLVLEGEFSIQNISKMLPLDYQIGD